MKKLLLSTSIFLIGFFTVKESKAQDFDLDFYQYFNANMAAYGKTTAKDAATAWRGSATDGRIGPIVTMNNISSRVIQNNRINNISVGDDNTTTNNYVRFQLGNDDCKIVLESTVDIKTIAVQYRSSSTTPAGIKIAYGDTEANVNTFGGTIVNLANYDSSSPSPGQTVFLNIPETGIRFVVISRNAGTSPKLYRIAASSTTFTTLPLNLLSFTAKSDAFGKAVNLNWKTTNEVNTKEFSIERRTDNSDFVSIGTITSKNTDGIHNYNFTDNNAVAGNSYYRLKQIDNDGKFQYSDIQSVKIDGGVSLSLYPNPTTDELNISHALASNASIKVLNIQGSTVLEQKLGQGTTLSNIGVSQLSPGTYILMLNNSGQQSTIKFIKK
ncbi:T9SS type A sorting domain-containing protein [Pedobacter puniceum]|uniref:T9SS type A sorting domain-containing protein n=1 Tax=Pedobacter puniceum TaxID=2666136 RepID=A0A7K0FJN9_9SPHI|nr:T9SS type A sorting domain-containing protein [Pedobacter puniceum]MRX46189.1 T9SS type A sorting domain-containing protein [Pedobacter puniceum]